VQACEDKARDTVCEEMARLVGARVCVCVCVCVGVSVCVFVCVGVYVYVRMFTDSCL
jgi:hypothetical protein